MLSCQAVNHDSINAPCLYALCFLCDRPFILNLKLTSTLNFVTALVRGHLQKVTNIKCFRNMFFTLFEVQLRTCAITFISTKCVSLPIGSHGCTGDDKALFRVPMVGNGKLIYGQFLLVTPFSTFFRYPASNPVECKFHKKM